MGIKIDNLSFEVVYGFNTKQLWVYESTNDVYIDPPAKVLDYIDSKVDWDDYEMQEVEMESIIAANPDWLYEKDYWYSDVEI